MILPKYYEWRDSIRQSQHPIRYPNGRQNSKYTKFGVIHKKDKSEIRFGYVEGRKLIYYDEYVRLTKNLLIYEYLLNELRQGKKLLIIEVDVPSVGKRGHYGENVEESGICHCSKSSLEELMNDPSEAFGHGLCLAHSLYSNVL
jgi:hypothetical protein